MNRSRSPSRSNRVTSGAYARLSSPETLKLLVDRLKEGIYITNEEGVILDANPAFLEMFGVGSLEEINSFRAIDLVVDPERRDLEKQILERDGVVREYELQVRRPDGEIRSVLDTAYAVKDPESGETLFHGVLVDITRMKELEAQLREQAVRDPLTGCWNRRMLGTLASDLKGRGEKWAVAVIDIDHFKRYNDELGHQAGDAALVRTARFLQRQVRSDDLVCRVGGDEFLIVMVGASRKEAAKVVSRLKTNATEHAPVPFSLGWDVRKSLESLESTIGRADHDLIDVRVESRKFQLRATD